MRIVSDRGRSISLWALLLVVLLGAVVTVLFSWSATSTLAGNERSRAFGKVALEAARFLTTAKRVLVEIAEYVTGSEDDKFRSVLRDSDIDYSDCEPITMADGIDVQGLLVRANASQMAYGWRLLVGAFAVAGDIKNTAPRLSPDLKVDKTWILGEIAVDELAPRTKHRILVSGKWLGRQRLSQCPGNLFRRLTVVNQ